MIRGSADFFEDLEFALAVEPGHETSDAVAFVIPAENSLDGQLQGALESRN